MMRICMHDFNHVPFVLLATSITLHSDLVRMVQSRTLHIVRCRNQGEGTAQGKMRMLGYIDKQLRYGSTCSKVPAERAGM